MSNAVLLLDQDVDDLATVSFVDEALMVAILRCRFRKKKIYTAVGEILLSLNPFEAIRQPLPNAVANVEPGRPAHSPKPAEWSLPHISVSASRVYQNLLERHHAQCCIFSGESGSGKTEASKLFLSHLMQISNGDHELEQKILIMNPLLEAFGNAHTSLNHNSSRFGKFIQLTFADTGKVTGAKISEYLLEKSRITHRNPGESNFHIFHTIMSDLPAQLLKKLKLDSGATYEYLDDVQARQRPPVNGHLQNYRDLCDALSVVGFSKDEQYHIFTILAAILCLGNVKFTEDPGGKIPFCTDTERFVKNAASLLETERQNLRNQLQNLEIYSRGEVICRPYSKSEAEDCRDSISKALYNRLFRWIIHRINEMLLPKTPAEKSEKIPSVLLNVGILDVFGFENLRTNSFEQLCINLANEQLQHFFNLKVFQQEQNEYESEGLGVDKVTYRDNIDLLHMFLDRPIGILSLMDEECHFPQGSDASLVIKFQHHFASHASRFRSTFRPAPGQAPVLPTFTICHYAGDVLYNAKGFLEKNRDSLPERLCVLLQSSPHAIVSTLFQAKVSRTGSLVFGQKLEPAPVPAGTKKAEHGAGFGRSTRKKLTLAYQFKASLTALLDELHQSETYFVRCIKPNIEQIPNKFDSSHVLTQLRHAGVLEAVWIRRQGFSYRPTFSEFMARFRGLFNQSFDRPMTLIEKILEPYGCQSWHLGKTKVFVKYCVADDLASRLRLRETAAKKIQRWFRNCMWRKRIQQEAAERINLAAGSSGTFSGAHSEASTYHSEHSQSADHIDGYSLADAQQVSQWFKDCVYEQLASGVAQAKKKTQTGRLHKTDWFFTNLNRRDAEALLRNRTVGCFLVRSNQSDFNVLVLSFKAPERCRHYLIDFLPNDKMMVRGESIAHSNLAELLVYYQSHSLSNYTGYLTEAYSFRNPAKVDEGRHGTPKKKLQPAEYDQLPPQKKFSRSRKSGKCGDRR
ncbi:unconventional myosin-VIIa-like [Paramacrobiotus metropolitanus]|uniref:unconventional myosin-VIIa-like n=1 Tax=Paramacrobiotus metropolitanus TaxID=2943436 RepID=UPI00244645F1|nr:unconventional myosin-VIIa-like [Paramacrobiotus metropolitanus]